MLIIGCYFLLYLFVIVLIAIIITSLVHLFIFFPGYFEMYWFGTVQLYHVFVLFGVCNDTFYFE